MCGLCGFIDTRGRPTDRGVVLDMCEAIRHRGPDGRGEAQVGDDSITGWLGHTRLKIVDLSEAAHQPMVSDDGSVSLVYNGEIYNFRALRRELEATGRRFSSSGDTEVVLRAYEQWGASFVERLDGMFAIAVWDQRTRRLLLVRDRAGKKPLFYAQADGRITFASEIKSLLQAPWVDARPNPELIAEYLMFGYAPHPATMLAGIAQVPPASSVEFGPEGLEDPRRYWEPLAGGGEAPSGGKPRAIAYLLEQAVSSRMVADVPLGAFLSGGIDSSLVVGLMAKAQADPVQTFSIGFPEDTTFDERPYARLVAERFGTRHREFNVQVDAVALLDELIWHHDQPFADSSAIPTYLLCQMAREHVTVALSGDGGDEVFGGYDRFRAARLSGLIPTSAAKALRSALRVLPTSDDYHDPRRRGERFLELHGRPPFERYQSWIAVFPPPLLAELLAAAVTEDVSRSMEACYRAYPELPVLDRILMANWMTYLPDDLAVKMDRMSMAHGLEVRSPFLDRALVEYMARVPAGRKVGLRQVKPMLRAALGPLLPKEIWSRPKHGFGVPMDRWFRGPLGDTFRDEVLGSDSRISAFLDRSVVEGLFRQQMAGAGHHGPRLWTLLTLERWLRQIAKPWPLHPPRGVADLLRTQ